MKNIPRFSSLLLMGLSLQAWGLTASSPIARADLNAGAQWPAVIPIYSKVYYDPASGQSNGTGICTGTFITSRLLLTASHCVRRFSAEMVNGQVTRPTDLKGNPVPDVTVAPGQIYVLNKAWGDKPVHPVKIHVSNEALPEYYVSLELQSLRQDLAILEFDRDSANTLPLSPAPAQPEELVIMLGYGDRGGAGGWLFGGNTRSLWGGKNLLSRITDEMLVLEGSPAACKHPTAAIANDWSLCPGDSGGPLVDAYSGQVLGVASTAAVIGFANDPFSQQIRSVYTDVSTGAGQAFVQGVIQSLGK